jgi:4'-phosphopantetheinyl transferase
MAGLSTGEHQRALRFHRTDDRHRFAAGRLVARELAAELAGARTADIAVRLECRHCGSAEHGKPFATYPGGTVPLSISHSAEMILVAATLGADVGADIERIDPASFDASLFEQIESSFERGRTPCDVIAFLRLWTLKEAALKCTGDGLMTSPRSFTIDMRLDPPVLTGGTGPLAAPMALRTLDVGDGYMAALALSGASAFQVEMR